MPPLPPLKLNTELLIELGYGSLSSEQGNTLLRELYEALETIVGISLARRMSTEQLDEFESYITANNEREAFAWLERSFPDYKQVVAATFAELQTALRDAHKQLRDEG